MKNNYLQNNDENTIKKYQNSNSYLNGGIEDSSTLLKYFLLPEEYDVFSNIKIDTTPWEKTYPLAVKVLSSMRHSIVSILENSGVVCILPKLQLSQDQDDTISLSLANSGYRIFFSFEPQNIGGKSYCGLLLQEDEFSVTTQTKIITETNYDSIVASVLKIIFDQA